HISFELHQNHVYVPVHAGGERLWWILDTGAGLSLIDTTVARRLGATLGASIVDVGSGMGVSLTHAFAAAHAIEPAAIAAGPIPAGRGVGGAAAASLVQLAAVEIGGVSLADPLVAIFGDGAGVMSSGEFFDGNLGGEFLRRYTLFLDYAGMRIILEPAANA